MNESLEPKLNNSSENKGKPGLRKILVADDEEPLRAIIKESLELFGYEVVAVENGRELLEQLDANPTGFDLIITDLQMPEVNGMQVLQEIKARHNSVPRILCSGALDSEVEQKVTELGGACLGKPFKLRELKAIVKEMIPEKENKEI